MVAAPLHLNLQAYAFAVAPGNLVLQQRIDAGLAELEATGRLEALRRQWLDSHPNSAAASQSQAQRQRDQVSFVIAATSAAAATVLVAGLGWQLRRRQRRLRAESNRREAAEQALAVAQARWAQVFGCRCWRCCAT